MEVTDMANQGGKEQGGRSDRLPLSSEAPDSFFQQDHESLATALTAMTVRVVGTDKRFIITEVAAWSGEENKKRPLYAQIGRAEPGTVVCIPHAMMGIPLTLIAAKDTETKVNGACVQIVRAEPVSGDLLATGRPNRRGQMTQTDIARAIGITQEMHEQVLGRVYFVVGSDELQIELLPEQAQEQQETQDTTPEAPSGISLQDASRVFKQVLGGEFS